ncbi:MAG TPA: DUF928 domain-containing protein [Chroococcales cyanobacterium]
MIYTKRFLSQLKPLFTISVATVSLMSLSTPLLAQPNRLGINNSNKIQIHFVPAAKPTLPDNGTPSTNHGTGSRGGCPYKKELPPMTNLTGSENLELTLNAHPTFWVYVPYTQKEAVSGDFSLQDGDNEVYSAHFQPPITPGIVSISLPPTLKPLEVGKTYNWYFNINCSPPKFSEPPDSVGGQVQRLARSGEFESEFKTAKTPIERITIYAKHHVWYDTLTELAQLCLKEPQNSTLKQAWSELLSDRNVGLAQVAQEPIVGTVTASSQLE